MRVPVILFFPLWKSGILADAFPYRMLQKIEYILSAL